MLPQARYIPAIVVWNGGPVMSIEARMAEMPEPPLDLSRLHTTYTNWYRVTGTPEELILDFGLTNSLGVITDEPIKVTERLVMNFFTAKRLLAHLHFALKRFETYFGSVEVDIQKRLQAKSA